MGVVDPRRRIPGASGRASRRAARGGARLECRGAGFPRPAWPGWRTSGERDLEEVKLAQSAGGPPLRDEGVWQTLSWSAQRLSDGPSGTERMSLVLGILLVLFFVGCAIASAFSEYGAAGFALCAALAAASGWLTFAGPMQFRHRAQLRRRLRESGVRAKGVITDIWIMAPTRGMASVLRYEIRSQDGATRTYAAYDETSIVLRRRVGDTIDVLYDPDQPRLAVVDDN